MKMVLYFIPIILFFNSCFSQEISKRNELDSTLFDAFIHSLVVNSEFSLSEISFLNKNRDSNYYHSYTKLFNKVLKSELNYSNVNNYMFKINHREMIVEGNLFIYKIDRSSCDKYLENSCFKTSDFNTQAQLSYSILFKKEIVFVFISNLLSNDPYFIIMQKELEKILMRI